MIDGRNAQANFIGHCTFLSECTSIASVHINSAYRQGGDIFIHGCRMDTA